MKLDKMIKSLVPDNTLYFDAEVDSDGKISSIEEIPITSVADMKDFGTNLVLNTILTKCYGISIAELVKDYTDNIDPRIINLSPIIKNADWENAVILDNSVTPNVTVGALEYISDKFKIYDSESFVDSIYSKLTNAVLCMQYDYDKKYTHVYIDGETNLMINVLAVVIGSNPTFTEIKVGEDVITNLPIDLEHPETTLNYIADYLIDKGYLDSSLHNNLVIASMVTNLIKPVTGASGNIWNNDFAFNNNGDFKYFHLFIDTYMIDGEKRWQFSLWMTKKELEEPVTFEYKNISFNSMSNTYAFCPYLVDKATSQQNMHKEYAVFFTRDMGAYSGSLYHIYDYPMNTSYQIFSDGIFSNVCDETYGLYGGYGGLGGNGVNRNELHNYVNMPVGPNSKVNSVAMNTPCVNNVFADYAITLPAPTIDSTTQQYLEDNNIALVCTGNEGLDLYFTFDIVNPVLFPSEYPFDTRNELKVGAVDPMLNVLINDPNTKTTTFVEFQRGEWSGIWETGIDLVYNTEFLPQFLGGGLAYYLTRDLIHNFQTWCWKEDGLSELIKYDGEDPFDMVMFLRELPYDFIENVDFQKGPDTRTSGIYFNDDGTIPMLIGNQNLTGYISKLKGYYICSGIHEVNFTLTGDNKIKLNDDFTDYAPYVKTSIYLPFVGVREISPEYLMRTQLLVKYRISNITGDFIVMVMSMDKYVNSYNTNGDMPLGEQSYKSGGPILIETGNMARPLGLSGKDKNVSGAIGGITSAMAAVAGAATMGVGAPAAAVGTKQMLGGMGAISGGAQGMISAGMSMLSGSPVKHSSATGEDAKFLMLRRPFIMMTHNPPIADCDPDANYNSVFNKTIGYRNPRGVKIKNMEPNYHELETVKLDGINCTAEEREMIKNILMGGFYNGLAKGDKLT